MGRISNPREGRNIILRRQIEEAINGDEDASDREIAKSLGISNKTVSNHRKQLENEGNILRRFPKNCGSAQSVQACLQEVCTYVIQPSPENDQLYDPVDTEDESFRALVEDIRLNGLINPIGVDRDGYIFDGHRRYAAIKFLGVRKVMVSIRPDISRREDRNAFLSLLKSCNTQRVKTTAEVVREGIVAMDDDATQQLYRYRRNKSNNFSAEPIKLYGEKTRCQIRDKISLRDAIVKVVNDAKHEWPLSDRKIFYFLLNVTGLLRNDRLKTPFVNSEPCYNDVTNMCTRLRISGDIPFDAIADETRPVVHWDTYKSVGTFVENQLQNLFTGAWRDLLQTQPNWVELLVEKNTVASSLQNIAAKYTLPMTSGRGYSSLPPRKDMIDRFRASGREKLIVIVVSDFDPEGCDIPNSFGLSLRDDFELDQDQLVIIKAALNKEQIERMNLHEGQLAKEDSSRYKRFVRTYGTRCWELEAVPTATLRELVEATIRNVLDIPAFEKELEQQTIDRAEIDRERVRIKSLITGR